MYFKVGWLTPWTSDTMGSWAVNSPEARGHVAVTLEEEKTHTGKRSVFS